VEPESFNVVSFSDSASKYNVLGIQKISSLLVGESTVRGNAHASY